MKTAGLSVVFGTAILLAGWGVWSWASQRPPVPVTGTDVTYICLETDEVIDLPVQDVPAINPSTGRRTLVRAVYSNATRGWVPAPSEEVLRNNRRMLSQNDGKAPLSFEQPEEPGNAE